MASIEDRVFSSVLDADPGTIRPRVMQFSAGTSGFSYDEWRGRFYPESMPASQMLRFYAEHLPAVEINSTFYQMPKPETLAGWYEEVPPGFQFVLKASRRITHIQRLANAQDSVSYLFRVAAILQDKLGPVLFQLPPFLRKDIGLLKEFLAQLPDDCRAAFEFRNPSWFGDDVYAVLHDRNAALCGGDLDDMERSPPLVATATWGYLRLRRPDYEHADIAKWADTIRAQPWQYSYAFFKHEQLGPTYAQILNGLIHGGTLPDLAKVRVSISAPARTNGAARTPARGSRKKKAG